MKNAALILNAVLLVAVGVLFYLHFSSSKKPVVKQSQVNGVQTRVENGFKIGYFEWDSVTNSFALFKQMQEELNQRELECRGLRDRISRLETDIKVNNKDIKGIKDIKGSWQSWWRR